MLTSLLVPTVAALQMNVIWKAILQGTEAPVFTARMADRKLRWEWLQQQTPFPFQILDKAGQKQFARARGASVAATLALFERDDLESNPTLLQDLDLPPSFVLKPSYGYQNLETYVVQDGNELLRGGPFSPVAAARSIISGGFTTCGCCTNMLAFASTPLM